MEKHGNRMNYTVGTNYYQFKQNENMPIAGTNIYINIMHMIHIGMLHIRDDPKLSIFRFLVRRGNVFMSNIAPMGEV